MRWLSWLIAGLSGLFGAWILHEGNQKGTVAGLNRNFEDWVIRKSRLPQHPPTPVTLVEMEDADTWTALEYSLFLKALPRENPPVVVLESLPAEGNTAFDRAFRDLAILVPRLILPVSLSQDGPAEANPWWLDGWKMENLNGQVATFQSVISGPPEALRGNTAVGVADISLAAGLRVPAFVALGKMIVPTLALRATFLSWRISPSQIAAHPDRALAQQHLPITGDGTFPVNLTFLPGLRRIASSDLLLRLQPKTEAPATLDAKLRGIVILGDTSDDARTLVTPTGQKLTRAEVLSVAIATLCNGPVTHPPGRWTLLFLLIAAACLPLFFLKTGPQIQVLAFLLSLAAYLPLCIFLAGRLALVLPVLMPLAVLALSFGLNYFAYFQKAPRHE